jgi:hypothetical protein
MDAARSGYLGETSQPNAGMINLRKVLFGPAQPIDAAQPGSFIIASVTFRGKQQGLVALTISANSIADAAGGPLYPRFFAGFVRVIQASGLR